MGIRCPLVPVAASSSRGLLVRPTQRQARCRHWNRRREDDRSPRLAAERHAAKRTTSLKRETASQKHPVSMKADPGQGWSESNIIKEAKVPPSPARKGALAGADRVPPGEPDDFRD